MMRDEILELLINRTAEVFGVDASELNGSTSLKNDMKAKSAQIVQITTFLEDEFDVEVPYMEFTRKANLDEIADFIEVLTEG